MASLNQVSIELQVTGEREVDRALKSVDTSVVKNIQTAQRLERQYAQLDKAFNSGKISAQMYAKGVQQLDKAVNQAYAGSAQFEKQVRSTTRALNSQADANHFASRRMNGMGMATQQVGYQVGDFLVQVQSGTNAFVAFGQQATQLVGILPLMADSLGVSAGKLIAISSVLGIAIPLATAFGAALARTGGGGEIFEELAFAIEPIQPLLDALAVTMTTVADVTIDFVNLLVNNLDRIVVAATVVAGFFAAKWVATFIAAGKATLVLNGALNLVRATLLRLPFIALIAGATELIYQFTKLAKGAGGFGAAFSLVGDVVEEVFGKIRSYLLSLGMRAMESASNVKAAFLGRLGDIIEWLPANFVNRMIGAFVGSYEAAKAVWEGLPALFARFAAQAVNKLVEIMEDGANALMAPINAVREAVGKEPLQPFDLSQWKQTVPEAEGIGSAARDAFIKAATRDYVGDALSGVRNAEQGAMKGASLFGGLAEIFEMDASKPIESLDKLREAMAKANEEGKNIDVRDWFGGLGDTDGEGNSGTGSATDRTKDALTELQERVQSVADTMKNAMSEGFMAMVEGTKSVKDAFKDMARAIIKELYDVLVVQQIVGSFNAKTGTGSGLVGMIMGAFQADGGVWRGGSQVQAFANGGVVSSPTTFPMAGGQTGLMGEAGPEAIMPLKRGKDGKLGVVAEGGGSVNIVQNFNISANGDDSVKRIVRQQIPQIAEATKAAVVDAKRRGGSYGRAFG